VKYATSPATSALGVYRKSSDSNRVPPARVPDGPQPVTVLSAHGTSTESSVGESRATT
jgi:hypothetical protein